MNKTLLDKKASGTVATEDTRSPTTTRKA